MYFFNRDPDAFMTFFAACIGLIGHIADHPNAENIGREGGVLSFYSKTTILQSLNKAPAVETNLTDRNACFA